MKNKQSKPWTRNQIIALWAIIIGALFKIQINVLQKEIKNLKIGQATILDLYADKAKLGFVEGPLEIRGPKVHGQSIMGDGLLIKADKGSESFDEFEVRGSSGSLLFSDPKLERIGIATRNPSAKLDIKGNLKVLELNSGNTPGSNLCIDSENVVCLCGHCK